MEKMEQCVMAVVMRESRIEFTVPGVAVLRVMMGRRLRGNYERFEN